MGDFGPDITSLPFIRAGGAAFAAAFAFLFSFYRFNPDRRQLDPHIRRVNTVIAARVGVGHGFVFFMLFPVTLVSFCFCFFRFRRVRHGEQLVLFFLFWRRRILLGVFRFLLLLLGRFLRLFRRKFPHAVGQHKFRCLFQVFGQHVLPSG